MGEASGEEGLRRCGGECFGETGAGLDRGSRWRPGGIGSRRIPRCLGPSQSAAACREQSHLLEAQRRLPRAATETMVPSRHSQMLCGEANVAVHCHQALRCSCGTEALVERPNPRDIPREPAPRSVPAWRQGPAQSGCLQARGGDLIGLYCGDRRGAGSRGQGGHRLLFSRVNPRTTGFFL